MLEYLFSCAVHFSVCNTLLLLKICKPSTYELRKTILRFQNNIPLEKIILRKRRNSFYVKEAYSFNARTAVSHNIGLKFSYTVGGFYVLIQEYHVSAMEGLVYYDPWPVK